MKFVLKLALYLGLLFAAVVFFGKFRDAYRRAPVLGTAEQSAASGDAPATNDVAGTDPAAVAAAAAAAASTNGVATDTNAPSPVAGTTNLVSTNELAATNAIPGKIAGVGKVTGKGKPAPTTVAPASKSAAFMYLGLFVVFLVLLAALGAWDFTQYLGNRAERSVMASDFLLPSDPDYEAAEAEWSKGNHLDAINLMRAYLSRNPNEQHVAIRIAEIYEKDLNNYLAAALELEEVLTKKLPREKWGWTAIHLVNLYSGKLNQSSKALQVLERIARDYPDTGAAKKARQRLGLREPDETPASDRSPAASSSSSAGTTTTTIAAAEPPAEDPNLPKGFRAKK